MNKSASETCHELIIEASASTTEIWLGDDDGHFVQRAVGRLQTSLLPGDYVVEFGLGTETFPVRLSRPSRYEENQLRAGPRCIRPSVNLDSDGD